MEGKNTTPTGYLLLLAQQILPSTTYLCWANESRYLFLSVSFFPAPTLSPSCSPIPGTCLSPTLAVPLRPSPSLAHPGGSAPGAAGISSGGSAPSTVGRQHKSCSDGSGVRWRSWVGRLLRICVGGQGFGERENCGGGGG